MNTRQFERFGKLDVVAHTVGGFAGGQSTAETDDATFQRMFELNVNSTFQLLRACSRGSRVPADWADPTQLNAGLAGFWLSIFP